MENPVNDARVVVSVTEARAHFYELLERAHDGEDVVITYRGKPYARLLPLATKVQKKEVQPETMEGSPDAR